MTNCYCLFHTSSQYAQAHLVDIAAIWRITNFTNPVYPFRVCIYLYLNSDVVAVAVVVGGVAVAVVVVSVAVAAAVACAVATVSFQYH